MKEKSNGDPTCYDRFDVSEIAYDDMRRICYLVITKKGHPVFTFGCPTLAEVKALLINRGIEADYITESLECESLDDMTEENILMIYHHIDRIQERYEAWKAKADS